jgi:4-hydroxy-tetrahydrodipicolinate synthase
MTSLKFKGAGIAMITPFRADKSIDFKSLGKLIEHVIANGIDYLVVLGTTGENVTLSTDEKNAVISFVIEATKKRVPIVFGIGGNNTSEVVHLIKDRDFEGIDAILSVCPYYNKPTQNGLYLHFKEIASACPVPIILYNVPGRTGSNMTAETTIKLASDFKNIVAIKEASGSMEQMSYIIRDKPKDFQLISGDDGLALPIIALGGAGVISVIGNAFPKELSDMVNFALKGNFKAAQPIHLKLIELMCTMFVEGNPGGVKAALEILKIVPNNLRLPLAPVSKPTYQKIEKLIEGLKS